VKPTPDRRSKLAYHGRMIVLAAFGGVAIFVTLLVVFYVLLALGVMHGEFR